MRLINSSTQILAGILLSFSAYAWNLPVGDFEFVEVADNVYVMHGTSGGNEDIVMPYLNYLRQLEKVVAQGLEEELEDYEIKEKVLPQFAYIK